MLGLAQGTPFRLAVSFLTIVFVILVIMIIELFGDNRIKKESSINLQMYYRIAYFVTTWLNISLHTVPFICLASALNSGNLKAKVS